MRSDRGFALLLVLWTLVLLTLITSRLIAGGQAEARLASNLRAAAAAEMLADGAVHEAVFRLLDKSESGWKADGAVRRIVTPGGTVTVRIEDQSGKINPNQASQALLQALFLGLGADAATARSVAASMIDWRSRGADARPDGAKAQAYRAAGRDYGPPQAPFRSTQEIGLVLGMTPALLDRAAPHLTLFYDGDPDPAHASPTVLQALRAATGQTDLGAGSQAGERTVAISVDAAGRAGGRFARHAVIRVGSGGARRFSQILEWRRTPAE